ncbi:MAG TPA: DUF4126 family protein [Chloroflexota bacterium]|nr:DUF4126 family protein [Chloroflexota bacterium]
MTGISTVLLAALAGLNPWVVLVIVVGLATFTRHAPLNEPYSRGATLVGLAIFAVVMGIEIVLSKLRRASRLFEPISLAAAMGTGAGLAPALLPSGEDAVWLVPVGIFVALIVRVGRYRLTRWLNEYLRPMGHIAASIVSDLLAGTLAAAVFALKL